MDWRAKAIEFLTNANFPKGFCHMKFREQDDGTYSKFGVVYPENVLKIYILDKKTGRQTVVFEEFGSIVSMLDAGWDVD